MDKAKRPAPVTSVGRPATSPKIVGPRPRPANQIGQGPTQAASRVTPVVKRVTMPTNAQLEIKARSKDKLRVTIMIGEIKISK